MSSRVVELSREELKQAVRRAFRPSRIVREVARGRAPVYCNGARLYGPVFGVLPQRERK